MKSRSILIALASALCVAQASAEVVYDNFGSGGAGGLADGTTTTIWGDSMTLTGGGKLTHLRAWVVNDGSSAGNLTSADIEVKFYDNTLGYTGGDLAATLPLLGTWHTSTVNFNVGPGSAGPVDFDESTNPEVILTENILITQSYSNVVGGTVLGALTRTGTDVGTSTPNTYYKNDGSFEGLVNTSSSPRSIAYKIEVDAVPEPASMVALAFGAAFIARRKRKNH